MILLLPTYYCYNAVKVANRLIGMGRHTHTQISIECLMYAYMYVFTLHRQLVPSAIELSSSLAPPSPPPPPPPPSFSSLSSSPSLRLFHLLFPLSQVHSLPLFSLSIGVMADGQYKYHLQLLAIEGCSVCGQAKVPQYLQSVVTLLRLHVWTK